MRWLGWLHRRCERERAAEREQFRAWSRENKRYWGAKNKYLKEAADRRYSDALKAHKAELARVRAEFEVRERLAEKLTATPRGEECVKVRLNDREHAEAMVAHVLETSGVQTEPYPCPVCPRQLFDRGRYWHVRTVDDPAERAKRDAVKNGKAKGRPDRMALRLSPEQRALMYERARAGTPGELPAGPTLGVRGVD